MPARESGTGDGRLPHQLFSFLKNLHAIEESAYESEARLAARERQHAVMQARQDIWQTIARYVRGIDEQRDEDLAESFTDDVVLQPQSWMQRSLEGKALALKAFRNYRGAFQHPRRFTTNHPIAVNDDGTATGYANWFVVQSREEQSYCG
jgi:ketosteroid isomerase-like protein